MSNVVCDTCGQTGMLINPGVPCLRRFADGTKVCNGTMIQTNDDILGTYTGQTLKASFTPAYRQALNRIKRKAQGICRQCSNKLAANSTVFCDDHLEQHREKAKQRYVRKNS